jgi:hypothetical protein
MGWVSGKVLEHAQTRIKKVGGRIEVRLQAILPSCIRRAIPRAISLDELQLCRVLFITIIGEVQLKSKGQDQVPDIHASLALLQAFRWCTESRDIK